MVLSMNKSGCCGRVEEEENGARRYEVWTRFGLYCTGNGTTLDKEFAICKNCLAKFKYTGNTTNMHSYLVRHHPELAVEERTVSDANADVSVSQPIINTVFKAKLPSASPRSASITKSIARFIRKDLRSHSVVENEGFRRILHTLEPRYDIPCRKYFTEKRKQKWKTHFNLLRELHLRVMHGLPGPQSPLWQSLLILFTSGNCSPTIPRLGWCPSLTLVLKWQNALKVQDS